MDEVHQLRAPLAQPAHRLRPGQTGRAVCARLVETVDIVPTLIDLCRLPELPLTDGKSLAPFVTNPAQPWMAAAYHCFNPAGEGGGGKQKNPVSGFAVRTADARYVEWRAGWSLDGKLVGREFYRYSARSQTTELAKNACDSTAFSRGTSTARRGVRTIGGHALRARLASHYSLNSDIGNA